MRPGLHFIVFGVPRSGTKGLVRALNLHPNVLCAWERFDYRIDHSRLSYPADFLDQPKIMHRLDRRKLQALRAQASAKRDVLYVGNKNPRYYLALDKINRELPGLRNILIYRSPYGFIPSWDRKEFEHKSTRWHAGNVGLFGFLDLLVCLENAIRQTGVFVFPYNLGLNESIEPILAALDFIGADPSTFDEHTFITKHLPKKATSKKRLPIQAYEREFLDNLAVTELDEILSRNWGVMTPELASAVSDYMRSIAPLLPRTIDDAFRSCNNPCAPYYGGRYVQSNRQELAALLELTKGSMFMADLQQFGIGRKLKYLYLQRSLLIGRLTSLRMARTPAHVDR